MVDSRLRRRVFTGATLAAALLLVTTLLGPEAAASSPGSSAVDVPAVAPGGIAASVTWDGQNISEAPTVASAFVIRPGQEASLAFAYVLGAGAPSVATAQVSLYYFGANLTSSAVRTSPGLGGVGHSNLSWGFGNFYVIIEGVYELDAQLLDPNGSVVWSEPFYVDARAPYLVGSGLVVFLLALGGLQIYLLAEASRRRTYRVRKWR